MPRSSLTTTPVNPRSCRSTRTDSRESDAGNSSQLGTAKCPSITIGTPASTPTRKMLDGVQDTGPCDPGEIRRDISRDDRRVIAEGASGHETVRGECHISNRSEVDVEPVGGKLFGAGPRLRGDLNR